MICDLYTLQFEYPKLFKVFELEKLKTLYLSAKTNNALATRPLNKLESEVERVQLELLQMDPISQGICDNSKIKLFAKQYGNSSADSIYSQIKNKER